jgi:ubiquitin carboxyl-terminal hydrolase 7
MADDASPTAELQGLTLGPQIDSDMLTPDSTGTDDHMDEVDNEPEPRADEFEAFMSKHMPELPDQETEAETFSTWNIEDWRTLTRREHGPLFECGGHPWRILMFPFGNNVDFASFYLEQGYEEKQMPEDWYACVQFMLVLWNPKDPTMYITHTATHRFTADEGDWGFTRFAELRRMFANSWDDRGRPMVEDNQANVTAYIRVLKDPTGVLWHNFIKYVLVHVPCLLLSLTCSATTPRRRRAWSASRTRAPHAT